MKLFFITIILPLIGSTFAAKSSQDVVSFVNDDQNFVCNGKEIKWFYPNGTRIIKSSDKYQINDSDDESVLTVKKINPMSIGTYRCLSIINDTEIDFQLKLYFPLTINHINRLQIIKENDNAILKCKTVSVPKAEKVSWYFKDQELVADVDYKPLPDGILLENVQADQAGTYSCVAIQKLNSVKNIQQRDMELIVEYGPKSEIDAIEIETNVGGIITLNCYADSEPSPQFTWLRNGYETFEDVSIRDSHSSLKVKIDSEKDFENTYTCLALNEHGRSNQTFILRERAPEEENKNVASSKTAGVMMFSTLPFFIIAASL